MNEPTALEEQQRSLKTMTPEWQPCYDGDYSVSGCGRVRRDSPENGACVGRILKQSVSGKGYLAVNLHRNGRKFRQYVHRIVAETFLGPCPDGLEVHHRDGDKSNNAATNLEYVTHLENVRQYAKTVTHCKHGHEFTPENTYVWRGERSCKACDRRRQRGYHRARRSA